MAFIVRLIGKVLGSLFKWLGILIIIWSAYWAISHYWTRSQMQIAQGTIVGIDVENIKSSNAEFGNYYRTVGQNDRLVIEFVDDKNQQQKFTTSQCLANDSRQIGHAITVYFDEQEREVNCLRAWYAPLFLLIVGTIFVAISLLIFRLVLKVKRSIDSN